MRPQVQPTSSASARHARTVRAWGKLAAALSLVLTAGSAHAQARAQVDAPARVGADDLAWRSGAVDRRSLPDLLRERRVADSPAPRVLVLDGPLDDARRAALEQAGVRLGPYVGNQAFLARVPARSLESLRGLGFVASVHEYRSEWRSEGSLRDRAAAMSRTQADAQRAKRSFKNATRRDLEQRRELAVQISLMPDADLAEARTRLSAVRGVRVLRLENTGGDAIALATIPASTLGVVAAIPGVLFVEEFPEFEDRNATSRWIVQSNIENVTPLYDAGLRGQGQILSVIENTGLTLTHCSFTDPANTIGPLHRKLLAYYSTRAAGAHANHVTATAAGDAGDSGDTRGVAYLARLVFNQTPSFGENFVYNQLNQNYLTGPGAFVHSNSWGNSGTTAYDSTCRAVDNFSWLNPLCLVIYSTANSGNLRNPENAKNVLSVVATGDVPSQGLVAFGASGPTSDGRRKPEIAAPGSGILSAALGTTCGTQALSGTSMATPAVSGVAVLMRQYFVDGYYPTGTPTPEDSMIPSGALLKAMLVNSAVRMSGQANYPDLTAGFGRLLADRSVMLAGDARRLLVRDVMNQTGDALTTGATRWTRFVVRPGTEDLRATMAFHDAPGAINSLAPVVNNLNLTLVAPGRTEYRGNVFEGGWSATGGAGDALNNLEQVMLQSPTPGVWFARVDAPAVNVGRQGFGLVVTGNVEEATCPADLNLDGVVDPADFVLFAASYTIGTDPLGDFNADGMTDAADFTVFADAYFEFLCP